MRTLKMKLRKRSHAALNKIDDIKLLRSLKQEVEEMVNYNRERKDKSRGADSDLNGGITWGSLGAVGITAAVAAILYPEPIAQRFNLNKNGKLFEFASIATACSVCSLLMSYWKLSKWFKPQYKEKYEKLSLILAKIDESLMTPRIPEEEVIILQ